MARVLRCDFLLFVFDNIGKEFFKWAGTSTASFEVKIERMFEVKIERM